MKIQIFKNPKVIEKKYNDKVFLYHIKKSKIYLIDNVGKQIWEIIKNGKEIELMEILREIKNKYNVRDIEKIERDVIVFLLELKNKEIIEFQIPEVESCLKKINGKKEEIESQYYYGKEEKINPVEILNKIALENNIILKCDLEVTYRCNLKCRHCYAGCWLRDIESTEVKKNELTTEFLKQIISKLVSKGALEIVLTGGEPLVREDITEIIAFLSTQECYFRLLTNSLFFNNSIIESLKYNPHLKQVEVSVYGVSKDTHEYITRQNGSFVKMCDSIRNLIDEGIEVILKFIVMRHNLNDVKKVPDFAAKLGCKFVYSGGLIYHRLDFSSITELQCSSAELKNFYNFLKREFPSNPFGTHDHNCDSAGRTVCAISPYGDVRPCAFFPINIGNLKEISIEEIWNSDKIIQFRKNLQNSIEFCKSCKYDKYCPICPAHRYLETKTFTLKGKNCCKIGKICASLR
ncbi:MAG: radical SAM protein [candidate division WOR-3 bacterium]